MSRGTAGGKPGDIVGTIAWRLRTSGGARRAGFALGLGGALTLALPPLHLWPVVVIAFGGLLWLLQGARRGREAFWTGWWFGLAYFALSLYWIAFSLLVDAARFAWMIPFATVGLASGFALFIGLATWVAARIGASGLAGALALAAAWTIAEWLRGHILSGFPWNLVATAWGGVPEMMQAGAMIGVYGLGLLTVTAGALPAAVADHPGVTGGRRWGGVFAAAIVLAALWTSGALRLSGADPGAVDGVRLRLVQPDIAQTLKWDPAQREQNFFTLLRLTRGPGWESRTHVIWPETATPFPLSHAAARMAIAAVTPPAGLVITGTLRIEGEGSSARFWNSIQAVDGGGAIAASYDKFHLVPFGEYVPLRQLLAPLGVNKITVSSSDFSAGPGPRTMSFGSLPPASPLICYEIIFPGEVVAPGERPQWLLNITNDAWFGLTAGPHQHFAAARFRAIEEGLPVVRAANNGISAVVDPWGRVQAYLPLGESGVLDAGLPRATERPPYARLGDGPLFVLLAIFGAAAVLLRRHRRAHSFTEF